MSEIEVVREFSQWSIVKSDYIAQEDVEITLAKYTRCRTVYHVNDIQQPKNYSRPWTFVGLSSKGIPRTKKVRD